MQIRGTAAMRTILLISAGIVAMTGTAHAQTDKAAGVGDTGDQEITVTARKRQETLLNVPVVETAIQQREIERFQTNDLKDIAQMVPGLSLGDSVLAVGTQVSLRGVGTSALDPGVDASVSLNIDGLQLSQGLAYTMGLFDVGQIEILKGPQALFYGKSSPGGVISVRSADPTDKFELVMRGGYEGEARERRAEMIVSGPISNTIKARLAGSYSDQDGFFINTATALPGLGGVTPQSNRISPEETYLIRGTVLWNPSHNFDARLKLNLARDKTLYAGTGQLTVCPDGIGAVPPFPAFISPADDCKLDRTTAIIALDPAAFPGISNNGVPYLRTLQEFGTLELNYHPSSQLTVTSTTGYYIDRAESVFNTLAAAAGPFLVVDNRFRRQETTEELRLNSNYSGPFNFTAGGFLERGRFSDHALFWINQDLGLDLPPIIENGIHDVTITTHSLFGQARYKVVPQVEIALGARWTDEKRTDNATDLLTGTAVPVALAVPEIRSKTASPELTVTYKPDENMTVFGALKQGYKSGSFNVAGPPYPGQNNAFGDEKVQGGELGFKSRWLDRRLQFNVAGYYYKYTGLQVGANVVTVGGFTETRTINAGAARIYGIESDLAYRPAAIEGLNLHASINWNDSRYTQLDNVPCYGGETIAEGCNELFSPQANPVPGAAPLGGYTAQSRAGLRLLRAPLWQANFGFDYELPVGQDKKIIVGSSTQYSSKYLTNLGYVTYQSAFFKTDLSLALQGPGDRWELALIGKNLNNAITSGNCANANNQAGLIGGEITGTNLAGPAGVDETGCYPDRGRELWVRLTLRPFG